MWTGEITVVATDYGVPRSAIFRLTPDMPFTPGTLTATTSGAVATVAPGHAAQIESLAATGLWQTAPTTRGATRESATLTTTSDAPSGVFRLRTTR